MTNTTTTNTTTSTSNFVQAIQWNNHGVKSLLDGNEPQAIEYLSSSIKLMKQELAVKRTSATTTTPSEHQAVTMLTIEKLSDEHGCDAIVFNQALSMTLDTTSASVTSASSVTATTTAEEEEDLYTSQDMEVYTTVVIFNLALAHQRHSIKDHGSSGNNNMLVYKKKAIKLYSMILQLLTSLGVDGRNNNGSDIIDVTVYSFEVLVKLATVNNLSDMQFECGDDEYAMDVLSKVSQSIRQRRQRRTNASASSSSSSSSSSWMELPLFQEPDIKSLLMNVLLFQAPKVAPAA